MSEYKWVGLTTYYTLEEGVTDRPTGYMKGVYYNKEGHMTKKKVKQEVAVEQPKDTYYVVEYEGQYFQGFKQRWLGGFNVVWTVNLQKAYIFINISPAVVLSALLSGATKDSKPRYIQVEERPAMKWAFPAYFFGYDAA